MTTTTSPRQTDALLVSNRTIQGDYHQLDLFVPDIAETAQPGQFIHLRLPGLGERILRRPFSIYDADPETGRLSIIYKVVGNGTEFLATVSEPGTVINLLGPLGTPFTLPSDDEPSAIVTGGYGCAATFLLAKRAPRKPVVLIGGRTAGDLLLMAEYAALGCRVRVSTNDGTCGAKGFVTELLTDEIRSGGLRRIAACGPNPMLKAVADAALPTGIATEISLDHPMCCGIGACFACVVKVKADNQDGWRYSRSCLEGPVYDAQRIHWD